MVFVGVHPTLMHVPPRFFSSTRATDHPRSARRKQRGSPAWPEPITMASYFIPSSDQGAHLQTLHRMHHDSTRMVKNLHGIVSRNPSEIGPVDGAPTARK